MSRATLVASFMAAGVVALANPASDGFKYVGCVEADPPAFGITIDFIKAPTAEQCQGACAGKSTYAALGAGCHCSLPNPSTPVTYTVVEESRCSTPCIAGDDSAGQCGGSSVSGKQLYSLYQKAGPGCNEDGTDCPPPSLPPTDMDDCDDDDDDDDDDETAPVENKLPVEATVVVTMTSCPPEVTDCPLRTSMPPCPPEGCAAPTSILPPVPPCPPEGCPPANTKFVIGCPAGGCVACPAEGCPPCSTPGCLPPCPPGCPPTAITVAPCTGECPPETALPLPCPPGGCPAPAPTPTPTPCPAGGCPGANSTIIVCQGDCPGVSSTPAFVPVESSSGAPISTNTPIVSEAMRLSVSFMARILGAGATAMLFALSLV